MPTTSTFRPSTRWAVAITRVSSVLSRQSAAPSSYAMPRLWGAVSSRRSRVV